MTPELASKIPWVTRLPSTQECDSYRYSHMTMRAIRDPVVKATFRCKSRARWRYDALNTEFGARSGVYCWSHFLVQLNHLAEHQRFKTWINDKIHDERFTQPPLALPDSCAVNST